MAPSNFSYGYIWTLRRAFGSECQLAFPERSVSFLGKIPPLHKEQVSKHHFLKMLWKMYV